jgi:hypothetical protein
VKVLDPLRHTFHKICKPNQYLPGPFESLQSVLKRLNHRKVAIIKIDIEGSEFEVSSWLAGKLISSSLC